MSPDLARRGGLTVALALLPGMAAAHAFSPDTPAGRLFLLGTSVSWSEPAIVLALLPLALGTGLMARGGIPTLLPFILAGGIGGMFLSPDTGPGLSRELVGAGLLLAVLVALLPPPPGRYMAIAATVIAALVMAESFDGHGLDLPSALLLGLVGAPLAIWASGALVVHLVTRLLPYGWVRVGWRIVASWIAAVAAMYGAFLIR